ncbi:MAG: CooT family nickel-binding protein [Deltaproteobacteria bacterium]|jgi:predicted RNA-binding protein|nr:CooT family nickel-binding protein [Deltaproteobacteria bacterium]MDR1297691.1 CooT family nickel-binding protein [Deltaproteobacteria bacterium]
MCESNIYLVSPDQEDDNGELFLEAVDELLPEGENLWRVTSIFGEQKILAGRIRSMHLVDHRIIFERPAAPA